MSDFLADNNYCGQRILKIVSKGNGILAELLRLKDNIPTLFRLENKADILKYGEIICDLSYFSNPEAFDKKIDKDRGLAELDEEVRENYLELLSSFYFLFESIFNYISELNRFVEDVMEGLFIQNSLESILYDKEGKQLLTEGLFLYGVMLLLVDIHMEGITRERILTSFYRYSGVFNHSDTHVDEVTKLFRSTGFTKTKRPLAYPLDYFQRVRVNSSYVEMAIGVLRSDDIYHQVGSAYPLPDHRSTAFGTQASLLAIILLFSPPLVNSNNAIMREITDKFFPDNWVVPVYMGFHINLIEAWESFKAAKLALGNTIEISRVRQIAAEKGPKIQKLITDTEKVMKDGLLTEENILEKVSKVINLFRECNVTLRWIILHCNTTIGSDNIKKIKQCRDAVLLETKFDAEKVLELLLNVAQLELKVKGLFKKLLNEKRERWNGYQAEAVERIKELADVFSGLKPLSRIEKNENLHRWLENKASQVESLSFDEIHISGRKIVELIRAFDEMLEFHGLESKVQVREWVSETVSCFHRMLRTGSINEDKLVTIQIVEDLGYAWGSLIDGFTPQMQKLIHRDPFAVSKLRAVFLKLASAMDFPMMRIGQAKSNDLLVSVSSYYSEELVSYVQKVLQIIPESVFSILHKIIDLQTNHIKEIPTRLDKDKVKEYAQLEERLEVSRLTHHMSVLAEGILMMQTTLVGIIRINPKKLLENGIRKELVGQVCDILHTNLVFQGRGNYGSRELSLKSKLDCIALRIDGIRRSFQYIGDYVSSNGLQIFLEEFSRLLNFATEQESNGFLKNKTLHFQSMYQSKEIPIPIYILNFSPSSSEVEQPPITFLGRLANELLAITDPKASLFLNGTRSWYDVKTHAPLLSPDYFTTLEKGLGIIGLTGLDKVLSFMIAQQLQKMVKVFQKEVSSAIRESLTSIEPELLPTSKLVENPMKQYMAWHAKIFKSNTGLSNLVNYLQRIGQLQLLRRSIQFQLRAAANCHAKQLHNTMAVLNQLLAQMDVTKKGFSSAEEADVISSFLYETVNQSETLGLYEPYAKVYTTFEPIPHVPLILAFSTINQLHKLVYSKSVGSLICRKVWDSVDGIPFVVGVSTFLTQMHPSITSQYVSFVAQYLNSTLVHSTSVSSPGQPSKEDLQELSAAFYLLLTLERVSPRREEVASSIHLSIPCINILPSIINTIL